MEELILPEEQALNASEGRAQVKDPAAALHLHKSLTESKTKYEVRTRATVRLILSRI
jgi:hypothetical protein